MLERRWLLSWPLFENPNETQKVKAFYNPPSLLFRQLGSTLLMGFLNRWRHFPGWLIKHGFASMPVANGAWGMGCIGYPGHPIWVTGACNLRCIHCHATSGICVGVKKNSKVFAASVHTKRSVADAGAAPIAATKKKPTSLMQFSDSTKSVQDAASCSSLPEIF